MESLSHEKNLSTVLADTAHRIPKRTFIRCEGKKITYRDFSAMATSTALNLRAEGLKKSEGVAILSHNCPEFIAAYFGVLRADGVVVPINTLLNKEEIEYILNDADTIIVLYSSQFTSMIEKISNTLNRVKFLPLKKITQSRGREDLSGSATVDPDNIAVILYTSGTTGRPKGAMLTHKNIISNGLAIISAFRITAKDRFIAFLPLYHSFAFTVCVIVPMISDASITVIPSIKPFQRIMKRCITDRITIFVAIPTVYTILTKTKMPFYFRWLLRLRLCVSGAAPLPVKTVKPFERRFKVPLIEGYGLTEASPVVCVNPLGHGKRRPGTVGIPLPGIRVKVVDENGNEVPPDFEGELIVNGPNVMKGYLNRIEGTADTIKDGWLYTGDIATIDKDGYVKIVDRKKDMIIVDGLNIYPSEVEACLHRHPDIEECAMVGISPGEGKEVPVMFVVKREESLLNGKDIKAFLAKHIAKYKVPKRIIFVEDLPRNPTGKVLKKELRKKPIPFRESSLFFHTDLLW